MRRKHTKINTTRSANVVKWSFLPSPQCTAHHIIAAQYVQARRLSALCRNESPSGLDQNRVETRHTAVNNMASNYKHGHTIIP